MLASANSTQMTDSTSIVHIQISSMWNTNERIEITAGYLLLSEKLRPALNVSLIVRLEKDSKFPW